MNTRYISYLLFGLTASLIPFLLLIHSLHKNGFKFVDFNELGDPRQDWSTCMQLNSAKMFNESWIKWPVIIKYCEKYVDNYILPTDHFINTKNAMRFSYDLKKHNFSANLLYLGEGFTKQDILAMRKKLQWESLSFIGTEPIDAPNYTDVGKYFPETHLSTEQLQQYIIHHPNYKKTPKRIIGRNEVVEFLTSFETKFYDAIWLDWSVNEYEILPLTFRGDILDELGITVCQISAMINYGKKIQDITEILTRTVKEKRYAIMRPFPPGYQLSAERFPFSVPLNLHMINIENKECIGKYAPRLP